MTELATKTKTTDRPLALFVLGMHRSGTSLLTRVLSLCGGALPPTLIGADPGNPAGHWEPRVALDVNDAILFRHGSGVYDPSLRLYEEGALSPEDRAACIAEIGAFFATLPAAPLVIIKEPRITLLSDMWIEAAHRAGLDTAAVIALRHPQEVVASLTTRDRAAPELSNALWLKYSLLAERHTRGLPRVFIDYANLMSDWRREVKRIAAALDIDLDDCDEQAIEAFLTPDLQRQRHCGPVFDRFGANWISSVYDALRAATRDERIDKAALDRAFEGYRASEHDFRVAFENYRARFNGMLFRTVYRPSVTKRLRAFGSFATRIGAYGLWLQRHQQKPTGTRQSRRSELTR